MSSMSTKGGNTNGKARRLSFSDLFSPSRSKRMGDQDEHSKRQKIGTNFYFVRITGVTAARLKHYRIVMKCGDRKYVTSWKTPSPGGPGLLVEETSDSINVFPFQELSFGVERRTLLKESPTIGESDFFTVSELLNKQNSHFPRPFTIELKPTEGFQPMYLEVLLRSYGHTEVPSGESRAQIVFEDYPVMVSNAIKTLDSFVAALTDPSRRAYYIVLSKFIHQMGSYIQAHARKELSYELENYAWFFLRQTTRYMTVGDKSSMSPAGVSKELAERANYTLRGFWLLLQLHRPETSDIDNRRLNFIETELRRIGTAFSQKLGENESPKPILSATQHPRVWKLKGAETTFPRLQDQGNEAPFHDNATFQEITQWLVDHNAEHSVLWLHGKLEAGTKKQAAATFLEASKFIGFPAAYYSFSQGSKTKQDGPLLHMVNGLIYQLSLFNPSLANAFDLAIGEEAEAAESQDFSRFQSLLRALSSLSHTEQTKLYPTLIMIDDLEPSDSGSPSPEFNRLLPILYAASVSAQVASTSSSPVAPSPDSSPSSPSSTSKYQLESLPFPSFLRILVLSRSLGNKPALIEQFAYIRDIHRLVGVRNTSDKAAKLYNHAVNGPNFKGKGKGKERAHPLESPLLIPIAEANSQTGED
ncbi:hypothetical protein P691DRAFT_801037 [Macrolepiota fuliginosa MF-IS2]|uniref:Nephrocystin 3-like N-terminal domain-containing protein n=1 Tax=Macrolepiota fuliginosa MF-IS2 TaxID=1400762 RepID=A0A9P5XEC7_9AGAR|nr:hypothetical protein P691DRAFT_801037 [Macrolepiota fuliginosa MF-IS2]